MKRFWIGSAISFIAIIALGFALVKINEINDCKKFLVRIGDFYVNYVDAIADYGNLEDKTSEYAINKVEYAEFCGDTCIFFLERLPEKYDEELISKATHKLSLSEIENLKNAIAFYEEIVGAKHVN